MRLNVGCGNDRRKGYVNVDLRADVADVVAPADQLPFTEVDEILASDILEHFPDTRTFDVLSEWRRVLKPGGKLTVKVPNMEALSKAILDNPKFAPVFIRNIYGGHRWGPDGAWDTHHTGWTPDMLADTLNAAGFDVVSNDHGLNQRVEAVRR